MIKNILIAVLIIVIVALGFFVTRNNSDVNNEPSSVSNEKSGYILGGTWKHEETAELVPGGTTPVWEYTLNIDDNDETKGTLYIDGYQTMTRLNIVIKKLNDSANIVFDSYAKGNQFQPYAKGDILLSIGPVEPNKMVIEWYKMQSNNQTGQSEAYFERVSNN